MKSIPNAPQKTSVGRAHDSPYGGSAKNFNGDVASRGEEEDNSSFKYSNRMMFVKGLVCWVLFIFVWLGIFVLLDNNSGDPSQVCRFEANRNLCTFKRVAFALSASLLLPNLFEMGFTSIILIGDQKKHTLRLLERIANYGLLEYMIRGFFLGIAAVLFSVPALLVMIVCGLPSRLLRACIRSEEAPEDRRAWWSAFNRVWGLAPDAMLTWSLFPVSYFVIMDSTTAAGVITNLVAVTVFASLDDIIVQMLLSPQQAVIFVFKLYLGKHVKDIGRLPGDEV